MKAIQKYPFAEGLVKCFGYSSWNIEPDEALRYKQAKVVRPGKYGERNWSGVKDESDAERWLAQKGWLGAVIRTGFIVVDIDDAITGELLYKMLVALQVKCTVIRTPRGYQFIFKDSGLVKKQSTAQQTRLGVKVDYRLATMGYIILPTKGTMTEGMMAKLPKREFIGDIEYQCSVLPQYLLPVQRETAENRVVLPVEQSKVKRHDVFLSHCGRLKLFGATKEETCEALKLINEYFTVPPKPVEEIESMVAWSYDGARQQEQSSMRLSMSQPITPAAMKEPAEQNYISVDKNSVDANDDSEDEAAPPRAKKVLTIEMVETASLPEVKEDWLLEKFFARGRLTEIFGEPGAGKSLFVQSMFQHQAENHLLLPMQSGLRCLYILG
ncbi:MAG: bifunctional DNA primase/polymerase, partial [Rhizobacter sp.]|nr:bifunctional DNA primase/polymerase [Chlorobiales bacterium]